MNAAMTQSAKVVDFSACPERSIKGAILRFVHGIHDHRVSPVTLAEIQRWFRATPKAFVAAKLDELVQSGHVVMLRNGINRRCVCVYCISNMGLARMLGMSSWDTPHGRKMYDSRDE